MQHKLDIYQSLKVSILLGGKVFVESSVQSISHQISATFFIAFFM
jgi:hypothetical protein